MASLENLEKRELGKFPPPLPRENFHLSHENVIVTVQFYVNVMKKAYFGSNVLKLSCRCKYHLNTLTVAKETVVLYSVYLLSYSPILSLWLF